MSETEELPLWRVSYNRVPGFELVRTSVHAISPYEAMKIVREQVGLEHLANLTVGAQRLYNHHLKLGRKTPVRHGRLDAKDLAAFMSIHELCVDRQWSVEFHWSQTRWKWVVSAREEASLDDDLRATAFQCCDYSLAAIYAQMNREEGEDR